MIFTPEGAYAQKDGIALRQYKAASLGGFPRLVLVDHPGLILRLVDPFVHVRGARGRISYRRPRNWGLSLRK